jgi:WD40 repeat protein
VADVFISYSRQADTELVDRLATALNERGQTVWVDRADIYPSSPWRPEIEQAILETHVFVFAISPDSVASEYCRAELTRATELNKRIVPILVAETPIPSIPPQLAELHFMSFAEWHTPGGGDAVAFGQQVDRLVQVLTTDVESIHQHTRLLAQSTRWVQNQEDRSMLLRGRELVAAEQWLDEQVENQRPVLPEQQRLIRESRRRAIRRQRGSVGISGVVAVAMILLSVAALVQRSQAVHQSTIALAGDMAAESHTAAATNGTAQGLLALGSYERADTLQGRSAVVAAVEQPLVATFHARRGEVNGVAYDPSGKTVAAGSKHGALLWNAATGKEIGTPIDGSQAVNGVAFSPDGTLLALAEQDGRVDVVNVAARHGGRQLAGDGSAITGVAFGGQDDEVAGVTDAGSLYLWNADTGASIHKSLGSGNGLLSVAFSPDGTQIAVGGGVRTNSGENGVVALYGAPSLAELGSYSDQSNAVSHVAFDPAAGALAAADNGGKVIFLSTQGLSSLGTIELGSTSEAVAFNPSGRLLATSDSQGAVQFWNPSTGQQVGPSMQDGSIVYGLAFSPDGRLLASGDFAGDILVWSAAARMPGAVAFNSGHVLQLSINSDSKELATVGARNLEIWQFSPRKRIADLTTKGSLYTAVFSPHDPNLLAVGEGDGNVALYDTATRHSTILPQQGAAVNQIAFSPDGTQLAVGHANGKIALWTLASRKRTAQFRLPDARPGGVTALAFNPDGQHLAAAYESNGIDVFTTASPQQEGHPLTTNEAAFSLAYSPDGTVLAAGDIAGNVELFDASDLQPSGSLLGDGNTIFALAVSPDGHTLATSDQSGSLHLWDLSSDQELGSSAYAGANTFGLAFAPDGAILSTGTENGTIVLWPPLLWGSNLQAFQNNLCPRLAVNLSQIDWDHDVPGQSYQTICAGYPRESAP